MRKKIPEITMYFVCTPFRDGILQLECVTYLHITYYNTQLENVILHIQHVNAKVQHNKQYCLVCKEFHSNHKFIFPVHQEKKQKQKYNQEEK